MANFDNVSKTSQGTEFFDFADTAAGLARGVGYAAGDLYGLVDTLSFDVLPDWDPKETFGESSSTTGAIASGLSQFLTGFMVTGGALSAAARGLAATKWTSTALAARKLAGLEEATIATARAQKARGISTRVVGPLTPAAEKAALALESTVAKAAPSTLTSSAAKGAIADFAFFAGSEARLSDAVKGSVLENPISELLESNPDDPELLGRLKNSLEGLALGGLFDGLAVGLRQMHEARVLRQLDVTKKLSDEGEFLKLPQAEREARRKSQLEAQAKVDALEHTDANVPDALDDTATANRETSEAVRDVPKDAPTPEAAAKTAVKNAGLKITDIHTLRKAVGDAIEDGIDPSLKQPGRKLSVGERLRLGLDRSSINLNELADDDSAVVIMRGAAELTRDQLSTLDTETIAEMGARAAQWNANVTGKSESGLRGVLQRVIKTLRKDTDNVREATAHNIGANEIIRKGADDWYDLMVKRFGPDLMDEDISLENLTEILDATESVAGVMHATEGLRSSFGRALRTSSIRTLSSEAIPDVLVKKLNRSAVGPAAAAKKVTLEDRIMKAAGKSTMKGAKKRILEQWRLTVDLMGKADRGSAEFYNAFYTGVKPIKRGRRWSKTTEYMYFSMLSGPKTHMVNFASNVAALAYSPVETAASGAVQFAFGGGTEGIQRAWDEIAGMSSVAFDLARLRSQGDVWESVAKAWKTGSSQLLEGAAGDNLVQQLATVGKQGIQSGVTGSGLRDSLANGFGKSAMEGSIGSMAEFTGDVVGGTLRIPTRALAASDELFKQLHFRADTMAEFRARGRATGLKGDELSTFVADGLTRSVQEGQAYTMNTAWNAARRQAREEMGDQVDDIAALDKRTEELTTEQYDPVLASITKRGLDRAEEYTFTRRLGETSFIDKTGRFLQQASDSHPVSRMFFPFITTPINILKFAGSRMGVGEAMAFGQYGAHKLAAIGKRGTFDTSKIAQLGDSHLRTLVAGSDAEIDAMKARLGMAATTAMGVGVLAANGTREDGDAGVAIYGRGPHDPKEREAWEAAGRQPYSFRIGDKYISYRRLDPFATLFGTYSDIATYSHFADADETEGAIYAAYTALSENFAKKSYLTGVDTLMTVLMSGDPEQVQREVNRMAAIVVPNFSNQVNQAAFEDRMLDVKTMGDAMMAKLPYFSGKVEARRNVLGEEMRRIEWDSPHAFMSRWSPFPITEEERSDPLAIELAQTGHAWSAPARALTVNGQRFDLYDYTNADGESAKSRLGALRGTVVVGGMTLRERLDELVASDAYQSIPQLSPSESASSERVKVLQGIFGMYHAHARRELLEEFPEIKQAAGSNLFQQ